MDGKRKGFLVALIIGLLAAPALAVGAARLLAAPAAASSPAPATTSSTISSTTSSTTAAPARTADPGSDLAAACTVEGPQLVRGEAAGMLSALQQAALDALRPICAEEGFALAAAFVPKAEAQVAAPVAPSAGPADVAGGGEYDGDDYEDDEAEEDHEYEDDNEDRSDEDWAGGGSGDLGSDG